MNKHVINLDQVQIEERPAFFQPTGDAKQRFESRMGAIGARIGASKLGYNITVVPAGKRPPVTATPSTPPRPAR